MCLVTSLHLSVWIRLRCLSLPCFSEKETWMNRLRGREPCDAPSVQVTGATASQESCMQPRDSPSAEVPLY